MLRRRSALPPVLALVAGFLLVAAASAGQPGAAEPPGAGLTPLLPAPRGGQVFHADGVHPSVPARSEPGAGAAAVIGLDGRVRIVETTTFPWSAVVYLELYDAGGDIVGSCTGTFISPVAVLTAAHCLYDEAGWMADIRVVPAKDGLFEPFGWEWATDWWVPDPWYFDPGNEDWDWGLITLPPELGQEAGWWTVALLSTATLSLPNLEPAIVGYPADKPDGTMWFHYSPGFLAVEPFLLVHDIDTAPGQSGSAVVVTGDTWPNLVGYIVGVHVRGIASGGYNEAMRIDEELLADLLDACDAMGCWFDYFVEGASSPTPTPTRTATPTRTPTPSPTATPAGGSGFRLRIPLLARD